MENTNKIIEMRKQRTTTAQAGISRKELIFLNFMTIYWTFIWNRQTSGKSTNLIKEEMLNFNSSITIK